MKSSRYDGRLETLKAHGWLSQQPSDFAERILARCRVVRYRKGQTIYHLGDPTGGPFGLIRGALKIELGVSETGSHVAHVATVGFWTGEASALRRKPRAITLTAARESVLAHLPLSQFDTLAREDPEFILRFAELTADNTVLALRVIRDLLIPNMRSRIAAKLLTLSIMQSTRDASPLTAAAVAVTQADLAMMCGVSRKSLNNYLTELQDMRLVRTGYGTISILDREKLLHVSECPEKDE